MKIKAFIYRATSQNGYVSTEVVKESCDWGCLQGYDTNGNYQQFDSTEMYHAYSWGRIHGIKVECAIKEIEVSDSDFSC